MQNTDFLKLNKPELSDPADIRKISDNMQWIDEVIEKLNGLHASIDQRLTRLELKGESTDTTLSGIRGDISGMIRSLDSVTSRVNSLENTQSDTASRLNILSDRHAADITAVNKSLAEVSAKVTSIDNAHKSDIAAVNQLLNEMNAKVLAMGNTVIGVENDIKNVKSDQKYLSDKIAEANTNISALSKNIAAVDSHVTRLEGEITGIKASIGNFDASIKAITDITDNLDARVKALEGGPSPDPPAPVEKFYVYWGASAVNTPNEAVVVGLPFKIYTDAVTRTISVPCNDEYVYYAIPKDKGTVQFKVGAFYGGFDNEYEVPVTDSEGNTTIYRVYRSNQVLNQTAPVEVLR